MKNSYCFMLACVVLASGCASPGRPGEAVAANSEERVVPLGSFIPKKGANRGDGVSKADMQAMENDRAMNNSGLSNH